MRIIQATLEHLDLLTPLFVKYREFYGSLPYPDSSRAFLEKRLRRKESVIYLALPDDDDNRLLGFCQLYPSYSSLSLKRVWILNDIYVAEDARRQLVADNLIRTAKKNGQGNQRRAHARLHQQQQRSGAENLRIDRLQGRHRVQELRAADQRRALTRLPRTDRSVGAKLARDSSLSGNINADCPAAIAGKQAYLWEIDLLKQSLLAIAVRQAHQC